MLNTVINIDDDDDGSTEAQATTEEGEDNTLKVTSQPSVDVLAKKDFNNNNFYNEDDVTDNDINDKEETEERNRFIKQMNNTRSTTPAKPVLFIGDVSLFSGTGSSSANLISDDDELVNTTLKFYQRADKSFPSFKHALARKVNFTIPYVKQPLDIEEEHALLTAEVVPLVSAELDSQKTGCRQWNVPTIRKIDQTTSTFSNIEATKLFSLNLGLEKVLKTKINDVEFEEEFSKIFFSVYKEDAKQVLDIVGEIIQLDPPEDN